MNPNKVSMQRTSRRTQEAIEVVDAGKPIKLRALAGLGKAARSRVRFIGHGRLLVAGDTAQQAIAVLGGAVQRLLDPDPVANVRQVIELMRLQKSFNRALIDIGVAEIRAANEPVSEEPTSDAVKPFPCGQPLLLPEVPR